MYKRQRQKVSPTAGRLTNSPLGRVLAWGYPLVLTAAVLAYYLLPADDLYHTEMVSPYTPYFDEALSLAVQELLEEDDIPVSYTHLVFSFATFAKKSLPADQKAAIKKEDDLLMAAFWGLSFRSKIVLFKTLYLIPPAALYCATALARAKALPVTRLQ